MAQEEKARAYDEAVKVIKDNLDALNEIAETGAEVVNIQSIKNCFYRAFPVLSESEDERIRKEIIDYLKSFIPHHDCGLVSKSKVWISWLEKQGEQKPFDYENANIQQKDFASIEPKFKVGDIVQYIADSADRCKIVKVDTLHNMYYTDDDSPIMFEVEDKWKVVANAEDVEQPKFKVGDCITNGRYNQLIVGINSDYPFYMFKEGTSKCIKDIDKEYHLWTISDAKDGDVLQLGKVTVIFQEYIDNGNCKCYCSVCDGEFEIPSKDGADNSYGCHYATPATKEQQDLLFTKMKEAGYKLDKDFNVVKI